MNRCILEPNPAQSAKRLSAGRWAGSEGKEISIICERMNKKQNQENIISQSNDLVSSGDYKINNAKTNL
jgi:hypothetical protein